MAYPIFSSIATGIFNNIMTSGRGNFVNSANPNADASQLVTWIRVISGTGDGLIMSSNPNIGVTGVSVDVRDASGKISQTIHTTSAYGSNRISGMLGYDWDGRAVFPYMTPVGGDLVLRPSPLITGLEVKEGKDQISKHATLTIKCFSLAQCEMIQEYYMEPGHAVLIEYGWNTDRSIQEALDIKKNTIVANAANANLNQNILHGKRVKSAGDYDSFFGFIVGGNTTSEHDAFIITIKLRGMPGLPTFLQSHHTINELTPVKDSKGNVTGMAAQIFPTVQPYTNAETTATSGPIDSLLGNRRYKWMFNKLPPVRQTPEVQTIVNKVNAKVTAYGFWDLVNFDFPVINEVNKFITDTALETLGIKLGLLKEFKVGGLSVPKEKLLSENRYINFGLALEILNANNGLKAYKLGDKKINVKVSTNGFIGAFPRMFSTKPSKLLIPGKIPNFYDFYLNPATVDLNKILTSEIDNSILGKRVSTDATGKSVSVGQKYSFVQEFDLSPNLIDPKDPSKGTYFGYHEKAGYYGRLDYLYINFDLFYNTIKNSSNKSMRDVLMTMLNEMSSAVNSFWNFQLVESVLPSGDIEIKIIDENWAGKNTLQPQMFVHSGEQSVFLDATLDIDIPAEMTNQIILKREDYTSNPDSKGLTIGGVFSAKSDKFFTGIDYVGSYSKGSGAGAKNAISGKDPYKLAGQTVAQLKARKTALKGTLKVKTLSFFEKQLQILADSQAGTKTTYYVDAAGNDVYTEIASFRIGVPGSENGAGTRGGAEWDAINAAIEEAEKSEKEIANTNLNANLAKIDIVPNPSVSIIKASALDPVSGFVEFNKNFKIYCCDDVQLFDIMKNNAYENYKDANKTSQPLPIRYTFTILGKSGLRRGDIFNVWGIPKKYRDNGFFQIVEMEHTLQGNSWTTTITGQYRQNG